MTPDATTPGRPESPAGALALALRRPAVQVPLVLAACAMIVWPLLGNAAFSGTEGHRAVPAYHMLDGGDWLVPELFGRPYLRKPPGMPWAIAAASSLFGRTEWAARSVSALATTISALIALAFGRRWFGPIGGLYAGLSQALMPVLWFASRTADIEALHNLGVQLACLSAVDIILTSRRTLVARSLFMAPLLALGIIVAGLSKGPAGATALAGCLVSAALMTRSAASLLRPALLAGLLAAGAVLGAIFILIASHAALAAPDAVTQTVEAFLWEPGKTLQILLLAPTSLAMALPCSLALLFPWGPDAATEAHGPHAQQHPLAYPAARTLTLAVLISLAALTVAGVSNPRYTMPTQALIPPVAGYVGLGLSGMFILKRPPIARFMMLGHPLAIAIGLLIAGVTITVMSEPRRQRIGGRAAGESIAAAVHPGAIIWADHLVEARPDVLWYALSAPGSTCQVQWKPLAGAPSLPQPGHYLVLRDDPQAGELERFEQSPGAPTLHEVGRGSVYQFSFRVLVVVPEPVTAQRSGSVVR